MEPPAEERPRRRDRRTAAAAAAAQVLGVIARPVAGLANRGVGTSIQEALGEGERPDAPRTALLNFRASWCTPCGTEAPAREGIAHRYRDRGDVVVLGVDITGVPETFLVDPHGRIAPKRAGQVRRPEELTTAVDQP